MGEDHARRARPGADPAHGLAGEAPLSPQAPLPGPAAAEPARAASAWRRFAAVFLGTAAALGLLAVGFVAALDPYGLRAAPGRAPGPIMDSNQRFMYPQIVRSGAYDAAVIGTSTARLLDPQALDRAFGARFANLAMNAATPYEQTRLAELFLRTVRPKAMLFALDANWCDPQADRHRLTFRPFPPWLYEDAPLLPALRQVNWRSLTIAGGVALHRLGLAPERIRGDGFAVFTPPEASYDAARARAHIHSGVTALDDPDAARDAAKAGAEDGPMPALPWLDGLLAAVPGDALKLVAFMPVNVAAQGRPGTPQGAREAACKAEVARIGARRGATVVDLRFPSSLTTDDTQYWDALHYRLPVAARIVAALRAAADDGRDDAGDFYRVLTHP